MGLKKFQNLARIPLDFKSQEYDKRDINWPLCVTFPLCSWTAAACSAETKEVAPASGTEEETASPPPTPNPSALWVCGGSCSPAYLWVTFWVILQLSWRIIHVCNWISLLACLVEFQKLNSSEALFPPAPVPVVQAGGVLLACLMGFMSHTWSFFNKWMSSQTSGALYTTHFLIFLKHIWEFSKSSSSGSS